MKISGAPLYWSSKWAAFKQPSVCVVCVFVCAVYCVLKLSCSKHYKVAEAAFLGEEKNVEEDGSKGK